MKVTWRVLYSWRKTIINSYFVGLVVTSVSSLFGVYAYGIWSWLGAGLGLGTLILVIILMAHMMFSCDPIQALHKKQGQYPTLPSGCTGQAPSEEEDAEENTPAVPKAVLKVNGIRRIDF